MAKAQKKVNASKSVEKVEAPKLEVVSPVGNSGIPRPAKSGFDTRKVTLITKTIENRKIAGQAMIILNTLEVLGGSATQKDVVDNLIANGLATVQTPKRIYDFYRKMLVEAEYIKLD